MSNSGLIKSSIAKKYWMAFTGLFLSLFLVAHMVGNLQLLMPTGEGFNAYAHFMTSTPIIKVLSYVTYISILFHAIDGIVLTVQNRKARPERYVKENAAANSKWASRNMGVLGTILLVFIVTHMVNFWAKMHFDANMPTATLADGTQVKDLFKLVNEFFSASSSTGLVAMVLYVVSMIAMGFHLSHGFASAFQSLGLYNVKYNGAIKKVGMFMSVVVPAIFALIPVYIYLTK